MSSPSKHLKLRVVLGIPNNTIGLINSWNQITCQAKEREQQMYRVGMVTKSLVKGAATCLGNPSKYPKLGYQVANLGSQALLF